MEEELKKTREAVSKWTASLDSLKLVNSCLENVQRDLPAFTAITMDKWGKWIADIDKIPLFDYAQVDIKPFLPEIQRTSDWAQSIIDVIPQMDFSISKIGEYNPGKGCLLGTPTEDFENSLKSVVLSCHRISDILTPPKFRDRPLRPSRKVEDKPPPRSIETTPEVTPKPCEQQQEESPLAHELRNFSGAVTNVVLNIATGATVHLHFEGKPEVEINGPVTAQLTKVEGAITTSHGGRPPKGAAKFTQNEIATAFVVSEDTVARWDKGESNPPIGYSRALRERGSLEQLTNVLNNYKASHRAKDALNTKHVKHNISEEQIYRESLK